MQSKYNLKHLAIYSSENRNLDDNGRYPATILPGCERYLPVLRQFSIDPVKDGEFYDRYVTGRPVHIRHATSVAVLQSQLEEGIELAEEANGSVSERAIVTESSITASPIVICINMADYCVATCNRMGIPKLFPSIKGRDKYHDCNYHAEDRIHLFVVTTLDASPVSQQLSSCHEYFRRMFEKLETQNNPAHIFGLSLFGTLMANRDNIHAPLRRSGTLKVISKIEIPASELEYASDRPASLYIPELDISLTRTDKHHEVDMSYFGQRTEDELVSYHSPRTILINREDPTFRCYGIQRGVPVTYLPFPRHSQKPYSDLPDGLHYVVNNEADELVSIYHIPLETIFDGHGIFRTREEVELLVKNDPEYADAYKRQIEASYRASEERRIERELELEREREEAREIEEKLREKRRRQFELGELKRKQRAEVARRAELARKERKVERKEDIDMGKTVLNAAIGVGAFLVTRAFLK